jgi:hypothetical protein
MRVSVLSSLITGFFLRKCPEPQPTPAPQIAGGAPAQSEEIGRRILSDRKPPPTFLILLYSNNSQSRIERSQFRSPDSTPTNIVRILTN